MTKLLETDWLITLMENVQTMNMHSEVGSAGDKSSILWFHVLPQFLELILDKLDDNATIWHCRLVNSHWKLATNIFLEKRQLSKWTAWNPQPSPLSSAPVVRLIDKHLKPGRSFYVASPKVIERSIGNPFPSNSLIVAGFKPYWARNDEVESRCFLREPKCAVARVDKFLQRFGHHITSFTLHDLEVSVVDLEATLGHLPNLKALTFSSLHFRPRQVILAAVDAPVNEPISVSPSLTHVHLKHCTRESVTWLLDACANQLISLDMEGCVSSASSLKLNHLKQLKICRLEAENFNEVMREMENVPCLEYLSIILQIKKDMTMERVMEFFNRYSTTLTYLYLDIEMGDERKLHREKLVELLKTGNIFPVLKQLAITNVRGNWNVVKLKETLKPKFPMLETLWFHGHCDWKKEMKVERKCICVGSGEVRIGVK